VKRGVTGRRHGMLPLSVLLLLMFAPSLSPLDSREDATHQYGRRKARTGETPEPPARPPRPSSRDSSTFPERCYAHDSGARTLSPCEESFAAQDIMFQRHCLRAVPAMRARHGAHAAAPYPALQSGTERAVDGMNLLLRLLLRVPRFRVQRQRTMARQAKRVLRRYEAIAAARSGATYSASKECRDAASPAQRARASCASAAFC